MTNTMLSPSLPELPLRCLKTADSTSTTEVVKGQNTIIDFWTTKCTRCPDALDKLDKMAQNPQYANLQFISICCDKLDGAREIIEKEDELRWQNVSHYFMEPEDKETAKKVLGFKSVPFYVILNDNGEIEQLGGSKKVDLDNVPGMLVLEEDKENSGPQDSPIKPQSEAERVFVLDELDF